MKRAKLTKDQKANLKHVINKWEPGINKVPNFISDTAKFGGIATAIAGADFMLTGGSIFTLLSMPPLFMSLASASIELKFSQRKNNSNQVIKGRSKTLLFLFRSDQRMSKLFNQLSEVNNRKARTEIKSKMQDLYDDVQSIRPNFRIVGDDNADFKFLLQQGDQKISFEDAINTRRKKLKSLGN